MSLVEKIADNPASLAAPCAEAIWMQGTNLGALSPTNERRFVELGRAARELGFGGKRYFVEARRGLSIPESFEPDQPVEHTDFVDQTFEADFVGYSTVIIGRLGVRALCASFNNVILLPHFDTIPPYHILHVPVLGVVSIETQAA